MPGRCGYWYWPGRGGNPGCCVRTGCDGSGRGPPTGACGRDPGYAGRGGGGPPGRAGARPGPCGHRLTPVDERRALRLTWGAAPADAGVRRRGACPGVRFSAAARCAAQVTSAAAASASSAAVLRCAAASVGGTMRPGTGSGFATSGLRARAAPRRSAAPRSASQALPARPSRRPALPLGASLGGFFNGCGSGAAASTLRARAGSGSAIGSASPPARRRPASRPSRGAAAAARARQACRLGRFLRRRRSSCL